MLSSFVPKTNFNPINAIDAGVTCWGAAEDFYAGAGQKAQVGQVMAHFFGQVDVLYNPCATHLRVA